MARHSLRRLTATASQNMPSLSIPSIWALIATWFNTKKPTYVALLIDTSSFMNYGNGYSTETPFMQTTQIVQQFLNSMHPRDRLSIVTFGYDVVKELAPSGQLVGDALPELLDGVANLHPSGGAKFFDGVVRGLDILAAARTRDLADGIDFNYIVLLMVCGSTRSCPLLLCSHTVSLPPPQTEGIDTASNATRSDLLTALPSGADPSEVHIFAIGIPSASPGADLATVEELTKRTNGKYWDAMTLAEVANVYQEISYEI